jgi:hypothetical protein
VKRTLWTAGCLALAVAGVYGGLIITAARKAAAEGELPKAPAPTTVVPPLEQLAQDREAPTGDVRVVSYHTKSEPPDVKIFQTLYKGGTQIVFNHKEHAETYSLACIECHHVERCNKCHLKEEIRTMTVSNGKQALHENCIGCHAELGAPTKCPDCHKQ